MDAQQPEEEDETGAPRGPLIALIVVVLLIVGGLWLTREIHNMDAIQDCASSGRSNCAPVGK